MTTQPTSLTVTFEALSSPDYASFVTVNEGGVAFRVVR